MSTMPWLVAALLLLVLVVGMNWQRIIGWLFMRSDLGDELVELRWMNEILESGIEHHRRALSLCQKNIVATPIVTCPDCLRRSEVEW